MRLLWHHPLRWWRLSGTFAIIMLLLDMRLTLGHIYCLCTLKFTLSSCFFCCNTFNIMQWLKWLAAYITWLGTWFIHGWLLAYSICNICYLMPCIATSMSMNSFGKPRDWFCHTFLGWWLLLLCTRIIWAWIVPFHVQGNMYIRCCHLPTKLLMADDLRRYQRFRLHELCWLLDSVIL